MKIRFGILVNLNINNKCYLKSRNIIDSYNKVDTYNYISEIGQNWEDFDHETRCFESDAKAILNEDGFGQKSEFYLVAYLQNEDGKFEDIKKIKQLFIQII